MRLLVIVIAALLVTACWTGRDLYADSDSRPALAEGVYRMEAGDELQSVRVSVTPSGLTQLDASGEKGIYGFVPLGDDNRAFVAWFQPADTSRESEQIFALVERHPDGSVTFYQPACDGAEAELAGSVGATMEAGMTGTCRFPSRSSLESAMRQLRPQDYGASMKLVRIDE